MRLACARHLNDLEKVGRKGFPWRFDAEKALAPIRFIEGLPHVKGRWAAKRERLELEPWQRWIVGSLFGWVHAETGHRRFLEAYLEEARKNGKSVKAAGIGLFCMLEDGEFGAEVYSGATTEKQAWEVFRPARLMAKQTPELLQYYGVEANASNLLRTEDFSRFEPLIGKPGDGASPSCAIVDEFHEHDTPELYDTMMTGMGAREQPLMLIITTAGVNVAGPCYEKRSEVMRMLDGTVPADRLFGVIYTLDEDDDWRDPACWVKANPNLGVSVSRDFLQAQVEQAIRQPSKQSTIRTKHFNIWCGARSIWLPMEQWLAAGDPSLTLDQFADEECIAGLDMAVRVDLAARVLVFRRMIEGRQHFYLMPTFYLPSDALADGKNSALYRGWAGAGAIEVHDGGEIDFLQVQQDTLAARERFRVLEVGFDEWQAAQMAQAFREAGLETVKVKTTYEHMSGPMREMEAALTSGRLHHNANPVLNWCASNTVSKTDGGRIRPVKEQDHAKIDGMVAALMGLSRWVVRADDSAQFDAFLTSVAGK